jgi:hypothetical protein
MQFESYVDFIHYPDWWYHSAYNNQRVAMYSYRQHHNKRFVHDVFVVISGLNGPD